MVKKFAIIFAAAALIGQSQAQADCGYEDVAQVSQLQEKVRLNELLIKSLTRANALIKQSISVYPDTDGEIIKNNELIRQADIEEKAAEKALSQRCGLVPK